MKGLYSLLFLVMFGVLVPVMDGAFYLIFLHKVLENERFRELIISGVYAGLNACFLIFTVGGFTAVVFFTLITFALMFLYLFLKERFGNFVVFGIRVGVNLGVIIWLTYLGLRNLRFLGIHKTTPKEFFPGNYNNIWTGSGAGARGYYQVPAAPVKSGGH